MRALILIVDDDPYVRDALSDVLIDEGYATAQAEDGLQALEYLRTHAPPDLIVLDWMMPKCDGREFLKQQRANVRISLIPVLLLTADVRMPTQLEPLRAPCLTKPVDLGELLAAVKQHCRTTTAQHSYS